MRRRALVSLLLCLLLSVAGTASAWVDLVPHDVWFAETNPSGVVFYLAEDPSPAPEGGYQYIFDLYIRGGSVGSQVYEVLGFDPADVINIDWVGGGQGYVEDCWDDGSWDAGNLWHPQAHYTSSWEIYERGQVKGTSSWSYDYTGIGLGMQNYAGWWGHGEGLLLTLRVVLPDDSYTYGFPGCDLYGECDYDPDFSWYVRRYLPPSAILGTKWHDQNGDGVRDPGEPTLSGWTIYLDDNGNGQLDAGEPSTITNVNGDYSFSGLGAGLYTVAEVLESGWVQTYPSAPGGHSVSLGALEWREDVDFGNRATYAGEIRGTKWDDQDGDGVRDPGELGLGGWTIYLDENGNGQLDPGEPATVTNVDGDYAFTGLAPGSYVVAERLLEGVQPWEQTYPPGAGTHTIGLGLDEVRTGIDFGNKIRDPMYVELVPEDVWPTETNGSGVVFYLATDPAPAPEGGYEYIFDVYVKGGFYGSLVYELLGFLPGDVVNREAGDEVYDVWSANSWRLDNLWHPESDYALAWEQFTYGYPHDTGQGLYIPSTAPGFGHGSGLLLTIRVVLPSNTYTYGFPGCNLYGECDYDPDFSWYVRAPYAGVRRTLTVEASPAGGGTTTPTAGAHLYSDGAVINLDATPAAGFRWDQWTGPVDGAAGSASNTVTMDADKTVTANFVRQFTLTMQVSPAGGGTTSPAVGSHVYDEGTVVPIEAFPAAGYVFDQWTGDVTGSVNPMTVTMDADKTVTANFVLAADPPRIEALELFYNGKYADAPDPAKTFLAVGQASSMSRVGDDLHGNVTNCSQGVTGIRVTFDTVVTFAGGAAAAFAFEATPEQSSSKVFLSFTPPTPAVFSVDNGSGKTVVTIRFTNGEIKNRWLKTIVDATQVSASGLNLDGELPSPLTLPSGDGTAGGNAEFIIGNRVGDVDANYYTLLNDAIGIRYRVSAALVGISNAYDVDKNERVLLNDAILARNNVSSIALPTLP